MDLKYPQRNVSYLEQKNRIAIHGQHNIHKGKKSLCKNIKKQTGNCTKITATYNS